MAAFLIWAAFPLFFKLLSPVPAWEVLAHRSLWTLAFCALLLTFTARWRHVAALLLDKETLIRLALSSVLISANWLVFIWAIGNGYVLQSSLGYFITPLVNILLGVLFLRERHGFWKWVAVGLAATGVVNMVVGGGEIPWVALSLALSFGLYGLVRKTSRVDAVTGLFSETLIIAPFALAYLLFLEWSGTGIFGERNLALSVPLVLSGVVTALPLLLFVAAAKRLSLSSLGFFQYITPTGHFLLAVFVFGEAFTSNYMVTFGLTWSALILYSGASLMEMRT